MVPNPYVNVRCGGIRHRTDTIKKTFDPEWLCTFEFNLSNDVIGHKKRLRALKNHGLSVTVYSKDRFSSIFLGQVSWSFDQLFQNQSIAFDENNVMYNVILLCVTCTNYIYTHTRDNFNRLNGFH